MAQTDNQMTPFVGYGANLNWSFNKNGELGFTYNYGAWDHFLSAIGLKQLDTSFHTVGSNFDMNKAIQAQQLNNQTKIADSLSTQNWIKGIGLGLQAYTSYMGIKAMQEQLKLAKKQFAMAQEKWNYEKAELDRMRRVRDKINQSLFGHS
jgi:hypothetical protein